MMITRKPTCLIASATVLFLISCGEGADEGASQLRIDQQCTLTACKAQEQQCAATTSSQCNSCWDSVSENISYGGGFYDCTSICDSSSCYRTCSDDTCQVYGFSATLPQQRDEALYQACSKAQARDQGCGLQTDWYNCDAFARVERPEATGVYQCHAQTACSKSTGQCNDLPQTGVGRRFCDGLQKLCGEAPTSCTSPDQLDTDLFNWQRDQVNAEILRCLELGCTNAQKCVDAYFAALE